MGQQRRDPEHVLSQALRAMAGGGAGAGRGQAAVPAANGRRPARLTTAQVLLVAAIVGLVLGMGTALVLIAIG